MKNKNIQNKIKFTSGILSGVAALGLAIGGFMYTPKPINEFLEEKHKIDSTYNVRCDSLFNSYMLQKDSLEKVYINQLKDLNKKFK